MKRPVVVAVAVVVVLAGSVAGWLLLRDDGDGAGGRRPPEARAEAVRTTEPVAVSVTSGTPATFSWDGDEHQVTLVETDGSSARLSFASDEPLSVNLSTRTPTAVDLTADTVPDAVVTLTAVDGETADLSIASTVPATWNESGFTTAGGVRPYRHTGNSADEDHAVVPLDDGYLLLYVSADHKLNWERYDATGAQVTTPGLAVGVVETDPPGGRVTSVDAALLPGGHLAVVTTTGAGTRLRLHDPETLAGGASVLVGRALVHPVVVAGDGPVAGWVVAGGHPDDPEATDGLSRVVVSEVVVDGDGVRLGRQEAVTDVSGRGLDTVSAAAVDLASDTLVVTHLHRTTGEQRELRAVGVDTGALTPRWNTAVAGPALRGTSPHGAVAIDAGADDTGTAATVVWRHDGPTDGGEQLHVAAVTLADGDVERVWDGPTAEGSPRLQLGWPVELVTTPDGPAVTYYDPHARPEAPAGSPDRGRFTLRGWDGTGDDPAWAAGPLVLEGGKPILADVLVDLGGFAQTPPQAICGAPVALRGAVTNRGSREARDVTVTATLDGQVLGTAELDRVPPASSTDFSILWEVPADLEAGSVEVSFALTTATDQYTTGNDAAPHPVTIRQKGLVAGRVVDASGDLGHTSGWYPGLEGARVTVGDREAVTDVAGTFWLDDLEFGTYPVSVTREGYNPVTSEVTVSRTRPLGFVGAELDDHGTVTLRVIDEEGEPLSGVDVYLHGHGVHEKTPEDGEVAWDISAGTYTFSIVARGYRPEAAREVQVELGQDRTETVTLRAATTAFVGGQVVDARGGPVAGAAVAISKPDGTVVATPPVGPGGTFEPVELPARPATTYTVTVTGNGLTVEEAVRLYGGDDLFLTLGLVPGRGELRVRSATEGFTSWMVKAGWPGLGEVAGADLYAWFGNYAITVGAEYWEGTDELAAVDVTVLGGTYETHATKSELDFSGWFEPPDTGSPWDLTEWADIPGDLVTEHANDLLGLGEDVHDLFADGDDADDWIVTGQGNELLTWAEAKSDFAPHPEFDSSDPLGSLFSVTDAVPRDFSIPIVIGGSSEEHTTVRVDQVDVVRLGPGSAVEVSGPTAEWYSHQGPDEGPANTNGKRYEVVPVGVPYDEVVVYVWLTVQKYRGDAPLGTAFDQRERQLVVFHPGPQRMEGFIASGSLYRDPTRVAS